jgi:hypothetical protein
MVREAQKAGLDLDEEKLEALHCWYDETEWLESQPQTNVPTIEIDPGSPAPINDHSDTNGVINKDVIDEENFASHHHTHPDTLFHKHFHFAATKGRIHDVLQFKNGASGPSVVSWNIMEYMPFRRMARYSRQRRHPFQCDQAYACRSDVQTGKPHRWRRRKRRSPGA